jgi:hypothetical protein
MFGWFFRADSNDRLGLIAWTWPKARAIRPMERIPVAFV